MKSELVRIGFVGSRERFEVERIRKILSNLKKHYGNRLIIISGGAEGIDTTAENLCKDLNITFEKKKYLPDLENIKDYYDATKRYYARNKLIGKDADYLFAFPLNRAGGTMNTIKHFLRYHNKDRLKIID